MVLWGVSIPDSCPFYAKCPFHVLFMSFSCPFYAKSNINMIKINLMQEGGYCMGYVNIAGIFIKLYHYHTC